MDLVTFLIIAFAGSILAGIVGALLGLGGGIIIIPFLTLILGVDIRYAIGASIISVIATSSGAAGRYLRDGVANRRVALLWAVLTAAGAVTGALTAAYVSKQSLYVIFAAILAGSALAMFRNRHAQAQPAAVNHPWSERLQLASSYPDAAGGGIVRYGVARVPLSMGIMYVSGIVSGLLGIGNGAMTVPTMDLVARLPFKVASATSNFMNGITAAASAGIFFTRGDIVPIIAAPVALGVLLGASLGAKVMMRTQSTLVRQFFILVLIVIAVQMAARGLNLQLV